MSNKLTSVNIGNSVTGIQADAFASNQLTAVTIPSSVISLENTTFELQSSLGYTYTTLFDENHLGSTDPAVRAAAYATIYYVQLITADPSNPNHLADDMGANPDFGDFNGDGSTTDTISYGGHLINPAQVTTTYKSAAGAELRPSTTSIGNGVASYSVADNPTNDPNLYYRADASVTLTAPTIAGYQTPTPSSQTITLVAGPNNVDFVYNPNTVDVDFSTTPTNLPGTTIAPVPSGLDAAIAGSDLKIDDTKPCTHISNVALLPASGFTAPDTAYTTIGGIDFTLACTTSGGTADITYTLGSQLDLAKTKVYKYNSTTHEAIEITSQVSLSNVAGKTVIAYSATDGAAYDEDAVQNSAIVDPVYVATETPVVVTAPVTPTSTTSDGTTPLAATGDNILVIILGVAVTMGAGLAGLKRYLLS